MTERAKKTGRKGDGATGGSKTVAQAAKVILPEIRSLIQEARHRAVAAANLSMVGLYWNIGRVISTQVSETGDYGNKVIRNLSGRLTEEYGAGFSPVNLWDMRRFFGAFQIVQTVSEPSVIRQTLPAESLPTAILQTPSRESLQTAILPTPSAESATPAILQTPSGEFEISSRLEIDFSRHFHLGWSHYRILLAQADPRRRRFYFERACAERWSTRELNRQIAGALFERIGLSRDTAKLVAIEKKKGPPEIADYRDAFKDPYLLDFLGLTDAYSEKDLESAIVANLQQFLTELGQDFCFIRRQFPMRIDDEDYFLDLLFYHRGLKCLVAIDLKIGAFTASHKGQMDLYLGWLKRHEWRKGENEPVGLILCTSKRKQHVELLLASGPHKMQVSEYMTKLPDKKVLEKRLRVYSALLDKGSVE